MLTLEQTANAAQEEYTAEPAGRAAVISLHFSPAHASHVLAYGRLLRSLGFAVSFVLDEPYLQFADFSAIGPAVSPPGTVPIRTRCRLRSRSLKIPRLGMRAPRGACASEASMCCMSSMSRYR